MYGRAFFIPSIVLLFLGALFGLLASISMQLVPGLDVVRIELASQPGRAEQISRISLGVWGACTFMADGTHTCTTTSGGGYEFGVVLFDQDTSPRTIRKDWTRGLALVPIALAFATAALLMTFIPGKTFFKAARWVTYLATIFTMAGWFVEIALLVNTQQLFSDGTHPGAAFWMSYSSVVALISASIAQWMGKRRPNHDQDELTGEGTRPAPPPSKMVDWNGSTATLTNPPNGLMLETKDLEGGPKKDTQVMWAPSPRRDKGADTAGPYTGVEKGEDGRPWEYGAPPMPNAYGHPQYDQQFSQAPQQYGYGQPQQHQFGDPNYPGEQYDLPEDDGVSVYPQTAVAPAPPRQQFPGFPAPAPRDPNYNARLTTLQPLDGPIRSRSGTPEPMPPMPQMALRGHERSLSYDRGRQNTLGVDGMHSRASSLDRSRSRSGTPGPSLPSTPRPQAAAL